MCLIIHKPAGTKIPAWIIGNAMKYNMDGVGIMGADVLHRWHKVTPKRVECMLSRYTDMEIGVHFRMATHGSVDARNVHPFPLRDGGWLMHNGVLREYAPTSAANEKGKGGPSDTALFVRNFVNPLLTLQSDPYPVKHMAEEARGSALLVMEASGTMHRTGYGWMEHEGCWFSNTYAWDAPTRYAALDYYSGAALTHVRRESRVKGRQIGYGETLGNAAAGALFRSEPRKPKLLTMDEYNALCDKRDADNERLAEWRLPAWSDIANQSADADEALEALQGYSGPQSWRDKGAL